MEDNSGSPWLAINAGLTIVVLVLVFVAILLTTLMIGIVGEEAADTSDTIGAIEDIAEAAATSVQETIATEAPAVDAEATVEGIVIIEQTPDTAAVPGIMVIPAEVTDAPETEATVEAEVTSPAPTEAPEATEDAEPTPTPTKESF